MQVFIVRPFGTKQLIKKTSNLTDTPEVVFFDFDRVENELILPALTHLQLEGGTTGRIFESGEIREDMFSLLLLADIVIADISIHNANVFYELGIRHALKNKTTVLIKCPGFDETPFDILGFRYVTYDKNDPSSALTLLIKSMQDSQLSDRIDSPVFSAMPHLDIQDTEKFFIIPAGFVEETELAIRAREPGKLALLASEADSFSWKIPAHRKVGEALVNMEAYDYARNVWEKIKDKYLLDEQANINLATIYQRLSEQESDANPLASQMLLSKSDMAIEVLFTLPKTTGKDLSAFYALKGRNLKSRWLNEVKKAMPEKKSEAAIQSVYLEAAYLQYEKGYFENLHNFHCGINALGFLTIIITLAERHPEIWAQAFETDTEGLTKIEEYKNKYRQLVVCIRLAITICKEKMTEEEQAESWLNITEADFACLTGTQPARVAILYKRALKNANELQRETALRQVKMFDMLQLLPQNTSAALSAFPSTEISSKEKSHYLLFTGHMIDKPGRTSPRFPAEKELAVREKIKEAIKKELINTGTNLTGICGGSCGADIIFHEICIELGVPCKLFLALPREQFINSSVSFAGHTWVERFDNLYRKLPVFVMANSALLPGWLSKKSGYNIWERNNLRELHAALSNGGLHMTLMALWDGQPGDAMGGTEHMVNEAILRGAKSIIIDINKIE